MALTETQFPQARARQGGASRQQHFNCFLASGFAAEQGGVTAAEADGLFRWLLGCRQLHRVFLLKPEQIGTGDAEKQAITRFDASIRKGGSMRSLPRWSSRTSTSKRLCRRLWRKVWPTSIELAGMVTSVK